LIGVWINNLAWVPVVMVQAQGMPAAVAKLHVLELIPYLAILWIGVTTAGLPGAAVAWVLRVTIDALLMFWISGLWAEVFTTLCKGMAFFGAVQFALLLTAEMSNSREILAISLLIAVVSYSLHIMPRELRQMLALGVPSYSRSWRRRKNDEKP
jgi:hypothetical protein